MNGGDGCRLLLPAEDLGSTGSQDVPSVPRRLRRARHRYSFGEAGGIHGVAAAETPAAYYVLDFFSCLPQCGSPRRANLLGACIRTARRPGGALEARCR